MGGIRRGAGQLKNCTVESSKRLRVSDIVGKAATLNGSSIRCKIHWTDGHTGRVTGAALLDVEMRQDVGTVHVRLALPDAAGDLRPVGEQVVGLVASLQPHGGFRWRFLCPRTGVPCEVLLCPPGASSFAGRKAWPLSYLSQRRCVRDRPLERARAIRTALGDKTGNMTLPFPSKPLGMWWRTYDRIRAKAERAETASLGVYAAKLDAWMPGWRDRAG